MIMEVADQKPIFFARDEVVDIIGKEDRENVRSQKYKVLSQMYEVRRRENVKDFISGTMYLFIYVNVAEVCSKGVPLARRNHS